METRVERCDAPNDVTIDRDRQEIPSFWPVLGVAKRPPETVESREIVEPKQKDVCEYPYLPQIRLLVTVAHPVDSCEWFQLVCW